MAALLLIAITLFLSLSSAFLLSALETERKADWLTGSKDCHEVICLGSFILAVIITVSWVC